jgi:hypothetical protein
VATLERPRQTKKGIHKGKRGVSIQGEVIQERGHIQQEARASKGREQGKGHQDREAMPVGQRQLSGTQD